MDSIKVKSFKLFIVVVLVLTCVVETLIITTQNGALYLTLMWIPAISAIVSNIYEMLISKDSFTLKGLLNGLSLKLCNVKYILLAIILPLIYMLIPYIIYWKIYPDNFAYTGVELRLILSDCAPVMFIGIIPSLISAIGEEIGWRGYMVPRLNQLYGAKKALIISSLFWCIWHLPLILFDSYMSNLPFYYQAPMFILCILPVGIMCGLLSLNSKSVLPSSFLHAAHNNYDQTVLQIITRGENMFYFVSETGFLTAIFAWICVAIMYLINKRKKA